MEIDDGTKALASWLKRHRIRGAVAAFIICFWILTLYFQPLIVDKVSSWLERSSDGKDLEKYKCYPSSSGKDQHDDDVGALHVSKSLILSGSDDNLIKVWDRNTGTLTFSLNYHSDDLQTLILYGDNFIISGGNDKLIYIADLHKNRVYKLKGHKASVLSLAIQGNKVFSASSDGEIKVWDIYSRQLENTIKTNNKTIYSISVTTGNIIAASEDGTISLWDRGTLKHETNMLGHKRAVKAVHTSGNDIAVSSAKDKQAIIWDLHSADEIARLDLSFRASMNEIFLSGHTLFVASGQNEEIHVFALGSDYAPISPNPTRVFKGNHDHESLFVKENCIYAGTTNGTIEAWSMEGDGEEMLGTINGQDLSRELMGCQSGPAFASFP